VDELKVKVSCFQMVMGFCGVDLRVAEGRDLGFEVVGVNLVEGGRGAGARNG